MLLINMFCVFQAEDGIRDLVRSRGLGDVYKRQARFAAQPVRLAEAVVTTKSKNVKKTKVRGSGKTLSLIHI